MVYDNIHSKAATRCFKITTIKRTFNKRIEIETLQTSMSKKSMVHLTTNE